MNKTPWTREVDGSGRIISADFMWVAKFNNLSDMERCLLAVNSYDALVEALRDIASEDIDRIHDTTGPIAKGTLIGIIRIARAALEEAK